MGGCLSKKGLSTNRRKSRRLRSRKDFTVERVRHEAAPTPLLSPPPPEEEAVVKEVLTETPNSSLAPITTCNPLRTAEGAKVEPPHEVEPTAAFVDDYRGGGDGRSEEGEASDMCSLSESFSVSTSLTEKREAEEGETAASRKGASSKWGPPPPEGSPARKSCHQRKRSSSGELTSRRDLTGGSVGGGGGRTSPSPLKRSGGRPFPARDAAAAPHRARNGGNAVSGAVRGDHGDRSGRRRSVSPAAKRLADVPPAGGGGEMRGSGSSPSMRKASPGRNPRQPEVAAEGRARKRGAGAVEEEEGERTMWPAAGSKETLENPLVSLECFIFL